MADMPFHEAASIFPLMEGKDLEALADDIREHGLELPIELLDGQVIEGRNRYRACLLAGIDPEDHMIEVDPDDPVAYVISMNDKRRHLTKVQRTEAACQGKKLQTKLAKERQKAGGKAAGRGRPKQDVERVPPPIEQGKARDKAGKAAGVSGRTVDNLAKIRKQGSTKLNAAVDSEEVGMSTAAKLADLSKVEQDKALAAGKAAIQEAIKPDWAKGPTPQEQAEHDPERRWSASDSIFCMTLEAKRREKAEKRAADESTQN